ncbi:MULTISPECIES: ComEA family DNA-binding protein [Pseudoxanthomonas]|jgi:competence protein ComEA helix-hairpin-helix repeat region|uniref:Competence protein ComEA n=1 Tax=Pseudoxanthomonas taiwanensis J19 TaxID=935569 RepID=A0A562DL95_9GAMM|nr:MULTISPECIES: helix-hairpin-helix domain-containing protein [Pseudoxanthomonas]RRN80434.1 helix-hairpin-helix domain-containing protein [Pseudoxanthomonas sp. SGD-10]TWH10448.1 competence protein ComEA [Pseudoxanthomonas taiwanensis J19]
MKFLSHPRPLLLTLLLMVAAVFTASAADKVDINTASAAQLEAVLVGIGPSKAEAIVAHRKANGPFKSVDELALVKGIGLKTIERNRDLITVGAPAKAATAPARPAAAPAAGKAPEQAPANPAVARR